MRNAEALGSTSRSTYSGFSRCSVYHVFFFAGGSSLMYTPQLFNSSCAVAVPEPERPLADNLMLARPNGEPEREVLRAESPATTTDCSELSDDLEVLTPIAAMHG